MAVRNSDRLQQRREQARRAGLCITCFKEAPPRGRTVCGACSEAAKQRVYKARTRRRQQSEDDHTVHIFETAGDEAVGSYAYEDACNFYEVAYAKLSPEGESAGRVAEKIAEARYRTDTPQEAMPWFERALHFHQNISRDRRKITWLKLRLARQYWLNANTASALPLIESAVNGALEEPQDGELLLRARVAMAHYLVLLGRFQEASPYILDVAGEAVTASLETQVIFLAQQAIIAASNGEKAAAFDSFERALAAATVFSDGYLLTSVLDDYGLWALALGDLEVARNCRERALLVAHEQNITWRIAYLSLRYADLLVLTGDWERAGDLIMNASRHALDTPIIRLLLLGAALPLAVATRDRRLRQLSYDEHLIDLAFQSGEDARIASAVSAVAGFYVSETCMEEASALLSRGVRSVRHADHCWAMLVQAAKYCSEPDAARARTMLMARALLPDGAVAQACLTGQFAALGWSIPEAQPAPKTAPQEKHLIGDLGGSLTPREREIAELVLKGLTNRAIAMRLHISENTVETHMSSILMRLGVRSRFQLKEDLLARHS